MSVFAQIILVLHVVSGFTALVTGFLSMLNRKGGANHRLTGKIFFMGMTGVFISAIILSVIRPNPFLFMVGFFSYYLACSGYRALYLKKLYSQQKPVFIDWLINCTGLISGVGLIGFSYTWFQSRGAWSVVPFIFGTFCFFTAVKDIQSFYKPRNKLYRLISHGSKMGGAFAATLTAFIVVNFTLGSWTWILWILPGVLIGIWISRNLRILRQPPIKPLQPNSIVQKTKNMFTRLLFLILIFNAQAIAAQQVILCGKVVDESMQPIKYVSIGIANTEIGTVSDALGLYTLKFNRESVSANDSLKFSIIGYHSQCNDLLQLIELRLETLFVTVLKKRILELSPVLITSKKRIIKVTGTHTKSLMNLSTNFALAKYFNQNLGSEIGRRFGISKKSTRIEAFRFYISQNNFDSVKFRINIYSIKGGKPYQNLLNENIYITIKKRQKGWIESDLSEYGIHLNDDVIVSLEWVSRSPEGSVLNLPIVMPTPHVHFYKYGSQNRWKRLDAMSTYMELKVSN